MAWDKMGGASWSSRLEGERGLWLRFRLRLVGGLDSEDVGTQAPEEGELPFKRIVGFAGF